MKNFTLTLFCSLTILFASSQRLPYISAGKNQTIMQGQVAHLKGKAINVPRHRWSTNGTGTFEDASALQTDYTPGADDIAKGRVILTLLDVRHPFVKDQ
ncbi:MAG: hypothetical protein ABIN97_08300, partial [Ginsengibacter sp.]